MYRQSSIVQLIVTYCLQEIADVCSILMHIAKSGYNKEVLVITFYKEQRQRLEDAYNRKYMAKYGVKPDVNSDTNRLRIMTVDACQGSEADWVFLSTVRCNKSKKIGFLENKNRANVAISRAREKLVIVGSKTTLQNDKTWGKVAAKAEIVCSVKHIF